jgi:hypothetical protein
MVVVPFPPRGRIWISGLRPVREILSSKTHYMKWLLNTAMSKLTLGIILLLTIGTASAQDSPVPTIRSTESAVVRYQGTQDDMLVFNVSYSNPEGKKFVILITDQNGNQLFQDIFRDKSFFRQFKVPKVDEDLLTFAFRRGQDAPVEKRFAVNINSHLIREVAIKKL